MWWRVPNTLLLMISSYLQNCLAGEADWAELFPSHVGPLKQSWFMIYGRVRVWIWVSRLSIQHYFVLRQHTGKQFHCHFFFVVKNKSWETSVKDKMNNQNKSKGSFPQNDLQSSLAGFQNTNLQSLLFIMCHKVADRRWSYFSMNDLIPPNCWVNKKKSALGFVTYVTGTLF